MRVVCLMTDPIESSTDCDLTLSDHYQLTSSYMQELILELRENIKKLPEEKQIKDISDSNLVKFIRCRKLKVDKALETTVKYVEFYKNHPDWSDGLLSDDSFLQFRNVYKVLPQNDALGRKVCVVNAKEVLNVLESEEFKNRPFALIQSNLKFVISLQDNFHVQANGIFFIFNFADLSFWDQLNFRNYIKTDERLGFVRYMNDCIGLRLKAFIIYKEPMFMTVLSALLLPLMSKKLRERFWFCGSDLEKVKSKLSIDIQYLPQSLGGTAPDSEGNDWISNFISSNSKHESE